jgi:hypothetical protein
VGIGSRHGVCALDLWVGGGLCGGVSLVGEIRECCFGVGIWEFGACPENDGDTLDSMERDAIIT